MKKFLITGALGQIGTELTLHLRRKYGEGNVIASDVRDKSRCPESISATGPYEVLDVRDIGSFSSVVSRYKVNCILHLAGILSANAEKNPQLAWEINTNGLYNALEISRQLECSIFFPSSIAAFGPSTPRDNTPQITIQRPSTIYGITKVTGELLCDYYHNKYGIDTRGVRFPGLISHQTLPGGGTTDYAVHIYYEALRTGTYECFIQKGTFMDMMYMPDALDAVLQLLEADPSRLINRNAYNISSMSFDPEEIAISIRKNIPDFEMQYNVDPVRQGIAESWPNSLDVSAARDEWDFSPRYDLDSMTIDMLEKLRIKLAKH